MTAAWLIEAGAEALDEAADDLCRRSDTPVPLDVAGWLRERAQELRKEIAK